MHFKCIVHPLFLLRLIFQMRKYETQSEVPYNFHFQLNVIWACFKKQNKPWNICGRWILSLAHANEIALYKREVTHFTKANVFYCSNSILCCIFQNVILYSKCHFVWRKKKTLCDSRPLRFPQSKKCFHFSLLAGVQKKRTLFGSNCLKKHVFF